MAKKKRASGRGASRRALKADVKRGASSGARAKTAADEGFFASLHPKRFFLETWREADAEAEAARTARRVAGLGYDYRPLLLLCFGAALLAIKASYGSSSNFNAFAQWMASGAPAGSFWATLPDSRWYVLGGHAWWSAFRVLTYFLLPALFIRVALKEKVRDHGLRAEGVRGELPLLTLAFGAVLLLVLVASHSESFTHKYPFYRLARRSFSDLLAWELLYVAQFFSLEFFFRGHWLSVLRRSFGSYAIFIMVVPYCMVHFGKPLPETLGAILAGVFLGTLALKTRSIWTGFMIHCGVGISMDLASIAATGSLPTHFWPT